MILITTHSFGQTSFLVERQKIKTGTIVKTYNFNYQFHDTVKFYLADSTIIFSNPQKTIIKTITYSPFSKEPSVEIEYLRTNGEDSISKHFIGNRLAVIYETRFDKLNRIIYYARRDFGPGYDAGFVWTYDYKDSIISTGKISIQSVFVDDDFGNKRFHFRVLSEYDQRNRKIKEIRETQANDPSAQITKYIYDSMGSLIERNIETEGIINILSLAAKNTKSKCDEEDMFIFPYRSFSEVKNIIRKALNDKKIYLTTEECENYFYVLSSLDKQTKLTILKRKPYRHEGRRAIFTTTRRIETNLKQGSR